MSEIEKFKMAIESLLAKIESGLTENQDKKEAEIMADLNNWCCVHTTRYKPIQDKDGNLVIPSTAMAVGGKGEGGGRNTVHFTLNHVVENHKDGNWDETPYVIFARYNDVVKENGEPVGICLVDTYFSTDIDKGLVLPKESTYFIHPSNINDENLYKIGENEAVYKTCDFTDEETKIILTMLTSEERKKYDQLMNGEFINNAELEQALGKEERVKRLYEQIKAKGPESEKAFLRGLMADKRDLILAKILRDFVTRIAMKQKGFEYIDKAGAKAGDSTYTAKSLVGKLIEDVAIIKKVPTTTGAHYFSPYGVEGLQGAVKEFVEKVDEIINENNMDKLFSKVYLAGNSLMTKWMYDIVVKKIAPSDYYDVVYESRFKDFKQERMAEYNRNGPELRERYGYEKLSVQQYDNIEAFDPMLAKALRRQVEVQCDRLTKWRTEIEHNPRFQKLLKKIKDYECGNFKDFYEFLEPSIEVDNVMLNVFHHSGRDN